VDGSVRVLLADDHTIFRQGIARVLASYGGIEVVAETTNDEGAVARARATKPDVVIMQVQMPFERAKENLKHMREVSPPPKVIIVTMFENPHYMRELMGVGASAYLVKSSSVEHLLTAVRAAVFDPKAQNVVVSMPRELLEKTDTGANGIISARELEILLLAARGLSNRQIATKLTLAEGTVKRHLANTYSKIGVGSRGEAGRKALSEEWITIQEVTQENEGSANRRGASKGGPPLSV
jgi:DNA-binding NarL/FixJ family response regulator